MFSIDWRFAIAKLLYDLQTASERNGVYNSGLNVLTTNQTAPGKLGRFVYIERKMESSLVFCYIFGVTVYHAKKSLLPK